MPWSIVTNFETSEDGGDCVGTVTGTYTDAELFVSPLVVTSERLKLRGNYAPVKKQFNAALAEETNRRTVAAKVSDAIEAVLNAP